MATEPDSTGGCRPLWVPAELQFESLPPALRAGLAQIINPLYKMAVLEANSELMRTMGLTLVHLTWLELLGQIEIGKAQAAALHASNGKLVDGPALAQHLRLVDTKIKTTKLYVQLEKAWKRKDKIFAGN